MSRLETAWEPGKKYIYTLNFGGGYDADGKVILSPMKFTPTVEDWTDSPSDINHCCRLLDEVNTLSIAWDLIIRNLFS